MLKLPYPPSTNRYWRKFRGRMVVSQEASNFKEAAGWAARAAGQPLLSGPVVLELRLHPKKPKRKSTAPTRCIDVDNAIKVTLDALIGIAFEDDDQVVQILIRKCEPLPDGALFVRVEADA